MKILYVIHDNKKGGAALSFLEMSEEVRKQHEIYVLTPHSSGFLPEQLEIRGDKHSNAHYFAWLVERGPNILITVIRYVIYAVFSRYNYIEAMRVARKLKNEKFDLVHSNASTTHFGALLAKRLGIPHVWHIRELPEGANLIPVINKRKMGEQFALLSDRLICISKTVQTYMTSWSGSADKCELVYNGISVDNTIYEKTSFPQEGDIIHFLISGNICETKGQKDVVDAAKCLLEEENKNFTVDFIGRDTGDTLKKYIGQFEDYELASRLLVRGHVDNVIDWRIHSDVEIVASKLEGFGRVTIEAMRASNPVIGAASGGTLELIENGTNGLLFTPGNIHELADGMRVFITQPELIMQMGQNAYKYVSKNYTPIENANNVMRIYTEIVDI